jgi:hypothetical protein
MVDFVSFSLAIDTTLDSGVGGMVLFANEVRQQFYSVPGSQTDAIYLVRYPDGERLELDG